MKNKAYWRLIEGSKYLVKLLLGISEEEYGKMMWECGVAYVDSLMYGDDEAVTALLKSELFWGWYCNLWMRTDHFWTSGGSQQGMPVEMLRIAYAELHSPERMQYHIPANILREVRA